MLVLIHFGREEMDATVADWKSYLGVALLLCNLPLSDCQQDITSPSDSRKSSADTFIGSSKSKDDSGIDAYNG